MAKVLVTCMHLVRHFNTFQHQYDAVGVEVYMPKLEGQQFSALEMAYHMVGMDIVIAGDDFIDANALNLAQRSGLKAVIKWGIGTDSIDKPHAAAIGMPVYNTPGVFGEEVGDLALSHLLMLTRKTHLMHASVLSGSWLKAEGRTVAGLTAGVIGLGSIGQAIARRARAFGMDVIGSDVFVFSAEQQQALGFRQVPIEAVVSQSDILFVAAALTPESRHLLNEQAFATMKNGVIVINVSRGPIIDETALAQALATGKVAGAGLDVFEIEPLPADSALRAFADRCTFSTHNGSNTREAVARINQMTTDIALHVLGLKAIDFTPNRVA